METISSIGRTILIFVLISLFSASKSNADVLPTVEDINQISKEVQSVFNAFLQETWEDRLIWTNSGGLFCAKKEENFSKSVKKMYEKLEELAKKQQDLQKKIVNYHGDDWDERFGVTGLWRQATNDLYATTLDKCETGYWLAIAGSGEQREKILTDTLEEAEQLGTKIKNRRLDFLIAKIFGALNNSNKAQKIINELVNVGDRDKIYFEAAIEKIKLNTAKKEDIRTLSKEIKDSNSANDMELLAPLAILQRRFLAEEYERTITNRPEIADLMGKMILREIKQKPKEELEEMSVMDAELAAMRAWKDGASRYKEEMEMLSEIVKFQTPLVLYAAAIGKADEETVKAVELLIKSSQGQARQKCEKLDLAAETIAGQAAHAAYSIFIKDANNCDLTLEAFDNYSTLASPMMDEELEYLYSAVLDGCGQAEKAKSLLEKIAQQHGGQWRNRARFEIVTIDLRLKTSDQKREDALTKLAEIISDCNSASSIDKQVRTDSIKIYCGLLLESRDKADLEKVAVMTEQEKESGLRILHIKALRQLGRLDEAVNIMAAAVEGEGCEYVREAVELLGDVVDRIELVQKESMDFPGMADGCRRLGEAGRKCLDGGVKTPPYDSKHAEMYLAEIMIFAGIKCEPCDIDTGDNNDVESLRCRSRMLMAEKKYDEAGKLWSRICEIRKNETSDNPGPPTKTFGGKRSWRWWQAKYYELYCHSEMGDKEEVSHATEVLENSFAEIPVIWKEKLKTLKQ